MHSNKKIQTELPKKIFIMLFLWGACAGLIFPLCSIPLSSTLSLPNYTTPLCHKQELFALLQFRNSFTIDSFASHDCYNQVSRPFLLNTFNQIPKAKTNSWKVETDCCKWDGVTCHPFTGNVIGLDLSCAQLSGIIGSNSTLFQLRHLTTLNLAFNNFYGSYISPKFGNFPQLTYLNLSDSNLQGQVPFEIAQLSQLVSLDFSSNYELEMTNFGTIIDNLTSLTQLSLDFVSIRSDFPQAFANRSLLIYLSLHSCGLQGKLPSKIMNFPYLKVLNLGNNELYIDKQLSNLSNSLEILDLNQVNLSSHLPYALAQSKPLSLRRLYLSRCNLYGPIPPWVWNISEVIALGFNHLTGSLPSKLPKVQSLIYLVLGSNKLSGSVKLNMFSESKDLRVLYLSNSGISVITTSIHELNSTLHFPKLEELSLSSCNITNFPLLSPPKYLEELDLSNNNIKGEIPKWLLGAGQSAFWTVQFNLSHNLLTHGVENLPWKKLYSIDLSSNMLQGPLTTYPSNGGVLKRLYASNNKLNGIINPSICNFTGLELLDLSNNSLIGKIPLCLTNASSGLLVLNLEANRLNDTIPEFYSQCDSLMYLDLSNNGFEGAVSPSLSQCQVLNFLNLGNNKLEGEFPSWLEGLPQLQVLNLHSNYFHGPLTSTLKVKQPFPRLQILDLSNNNFSGKLPERYINNFASMMNMDESTLNGPLYMENIGFIYSIELTFNGLQQRYVKVIKTMSTFDLSNNNFEGEIPDAIGRLQSIRGLNLSHNLLTGNIPPSIGNLSLLDCLDLSSNMLSGQIPQELVSLTFLGVFNVSNNRLQGSIPHGRNFDTFPVDSYEGNLGLCGQPLPECGESSTPFEENITADASDDEIVQWMWEMILMGFGSGAVIGIAWGYYMLSIGKPLWFIRLAYQMELVLLDLCDQHSGRRARRVRTRN